MVAGDALACSCAPVDLERDLPGADGAVVGSVLERRVEGGTATYLLRVEQVYKGDISDRIEVVTPADGAACGIEAAVGDRLGLLLAREGGEWHSGLCSQVEPAAFLEATDIEDNALPPLNWGGYVIGMLVLALGAYLVARRYKRLR
ncbi:MAG TPA: hypothetical protein VML35_03335 [Gaiellaceae bacterium]|nr:hypothetical protein [Gaiellaceae bacterium]